MTGPTPGPLVVDPAYIARRLGVPGSPDYDEELLWQIGEKIAAKQAIVEAYLDGLPIVVRERTETGRPAGWGTGGYNLSIPAHYLVAVDTVVAELDPLYSRPTGYYTVTYRYGLAADTDPQYTRIRQWVIDAVLADATVKELAYAAGVTRPGRLVSSVSVAGGSQSVSYEKTSSSGATKTRTDGAADTDPPLDGLDFRRGDPSGIYQRPAEYTAPWPYGPVWPG